MKVTAIASQTRRVGYYSVFVDNVFSFSLSQDSLLTSRLVKGQELTGQELVRLKQLSSGDKYYSSAIRYLSLRLHSKWEVANYLKRKGVSSPAEVDGLLNKLRKLGLIDDLKYAEAYVSDHQRLHPASRRKMIQDLRRKHIEQETINSVLDQSSSDQVALLALIEQKRRQTKYHDDLKLMQYLSRQGFNYGDIKDAIKLSKS